MAGNKCIFCGGKATLLCDFLLGFDAEEDENGNIITLRKNHTCDAPMCRECATWQSNIFFSGPAGFMDTVDYCPICQPLYAKGFMVRRHKGGLREASFTIEQAEIIRKAHWGKYLNANGRAFSIVTGGGQICLDL